MERNKHIFFTIHCYFMCMSACLHICLCITSIRNTLRSQKSVLDSLELELQIVNHHVGLSRVYLGSQITK